MLPLLTNPPSKWSDVCKDHGSDYLKQLRMLIWYEYEMISTFLISGHNQTQMFYCKVENNQIFQKEG